MTILTAHKITKCNTYLRFFGEKTLNKLGLEKKSSLTLYKCVWQKPPASHTLKKKYWNSH